MPDRLSCIDELDACFVACEEAYVHLRGDGVAARADSLANALLLAAATTALAAEALADGASDDRTPVLLGITTRACRECASECERDGAHWLAPARDACETAVAACTALAGGRVPND